MITIDEDTHVTDTAKWFAPVNQYSHTANIWNVELDAHIDCLVVRTTSVDALHQGQIGTRQASSNCE